MVGVHRQAIGKDGKLMFSRNWAASGRCRARLHEEEANPQANQFLDAADAVGDAAI
jgi:hypothetical protein